MTAPPRDGGQAPPHLAAALAHARANRHVFPCKPDKKPLTRTGFKEATLDPARIEVWWTKNPEALIGLPTGVVNKVFVLDIDIDPATGKDGDTALEDLLKAHGGLPHTVEALTPRGGRHLYFLHPGPEWEIPNSTSKLGPGLDIRGDGGYVIAAPSRLPDGRAYTWEGSSDPDEGVRAAPAPAWLLALVARPKGGMGGNQVPTQQTNPDRITEGTRNDTLFRLGRSLRAKGLTDIGILAALRAENGERCDPPLPEPELQEIARQVCTVAPGYSPEVQAKIDAREAAAPPWPDEPPLSNRKHATDLPASWPDPADLSAVVVPEPYPVAHLPEIARAAVVEYQAWGRQPMAMVAMSCLGQMALACQGLADVARNEHLVSPISINLKVLAESGERKTAADKLFGRAAREWQAAERERLLPDHRRSAAMAKDWHARMEGVKKKITTLASKDAKEDEEELHRLRERLVELEQNPIVARPLPLLTYEDTTPAALAYALATGWPSAGLFSDEAGTVVGGHGMGEDSATSLLALLNLLWDGRDYVPTRKQAAVAELRGRRFSCFLMMQPNLLMKLIERGARHIGFIARFLIAAPQTTMGERLYRDPPAGWQALPAFEKRITSLLETPLPIDQSGSDKGLLMRLTPPVMHLSPAAKRAWVDYHDSVERELVQFGEFEAVRDVASKSAENACRLAAICQIFAEGRAGPVLEEEHMLSGIGLAAWHLSEARRLFFEVDAPQNLTDARELSAWLAGKGRELADNHGVPIISQEGEIALRDIQRIGPNKVRDSARRDAAVDVLIEAGHVRQLHRGKQKRLLVNPKLMVRQ